MDDQVVGDAAGDGVGAGATDKDGAAGSGGEVVGSVPADENARPLAALEGVVAVEEDLAVEDQLNDEVRDLLSQYSDYMRKEGVSYQEMFRRIKNTLIKERKVIRAAGISVD